MATCRAVPFTAVAFEDGFWAPRQAAVRTATIPFLYRQYEKAGIVAALDVRAPVDALPIPCEVTPIGTKPATPVMYWDSDIGKWIEAAAYTLATRRDADLEALIDDIVARIEAAQQPDGYFNSYFQRRAPEAKWSNLRDWHELYCAGHLMEGAVAYAAATGKRRLLDAMCRYADLIARIFGRGERQRHGYCGHEEIELALVKLARFTGEARYMDLARYFIDERGRQPHYFDSEARTRGSDPAAWYHRIYEYNQSHVPVREQDKVVGHAVRAMYLYSAMADLAAEDGDGGLRDACVRLWRDLTEKRLYVTGGLGPSWTNEGFTRDYDLPNETAYAEDLRRGRAGVLGASHAADDRRIPLRRHHGACAVQWRGERHIAARRSLLLREPPGEPRRRRALGLASLSVLSREHRAAGRVTRQLCRLCRAGRIVFTPLWSESAGGNHRWRRGDIAAGDAVPVGRRCSNHRRSSASGAFRTADAQSRVE